MTGQEGRRERWRLVVAAAAVSTALLGAGAISVLATTEDANQSFPQMTFSQMPQTTTEDTGLQQTDSFGYIPQHETTLPTNGNGPGAPGPFGNGPFDNPGPPLPGGPGLPAHATVAPTLTSPAG
ncbi:hypothetical protein AB4Z09_15905 [Rhodococcus sp. TAF43]|uniref:hypothetical protein n=1 Tax=unclassified Rhodococcus (in: high G+C Gram-positive bacteria) TaxID=192944 RepID=UPI0020C60569|nr:hypothetical protein [Rhodococcus sp. W8901]